MKKSKLNKQKKTIELISNHNNYKHVLQRQQYHLPQRYIHAS